MKETRELKQIKQAIDKWIKKHKGDVIFHGGFMAFDKKGEPVDDMIIAYGPKDMIKISNKSLVQYLKEEKEDFVNW